MRKKFRQLSLQAKMSSIYVLAHLVVFAVTVILLLGINSMSSEIDKVYQGNLRLNEVSDALMAVQDSMPDTAFHSLKGGSRHLIAHILHQLGICRKNTWTS